MLYGLLGQHSGLFLPDLKESHFFALAGKPVSFTDSASRTMKKTAVWQERAYLDLFAEANSRICGEICPTYLYADGAAERIKAVRPDAKIIILLRDPIERSFSAYRHMQARGAETAHCFEDALEQEKAHVAANWQAMAHYKAASFYAPQVKQYLAAFGSDQVLFIPFEDLKADPIAVADRVLDYIGLPSLNALAQMSQTNKTQVVENRLIKDLLVNRKFGVKQLRKLLPKRFRAQMKERLLGLFAAKKETVSAETRGRLRQEFLPDIVELEALTGLSFENWKH